LFSGHSLEELNRLQLEISCLKQHVRHHTFDLSLDSHLLYSQFRLVLLFRC
jgi:hypothetical protein